MNLPSYANVIEVCPRDGLQNLNTVIPIELKILLLRQLIRCGFKKIETVSFVSPKHIPQMADAEEIVAAIREDAAHAGITLTALVPNLIGVDMAQRAGITNVNYVISVSERHNLANTRRTVRDSLKQLALIREKFPEFFLEVSLATSFGCVYQGTIDPGSVIKLAKETLNIGADKIILADTVGAANPLQVTQLISQFRETFPGSIPRLHFHNAQGVGLANVLASLQLGCNEFDSAVGGLGGCPSVPGAAGNIATEDLNNMLTQMGINTNVDQEKLLAAASIISENIISPSLSHMPGRNICLTNP